MTRLAIIAGAVATTAAMAGASPAEARVEHQISPYVEVEQIATASSSTDDVLTYTSVVAGVDASVQTERTSVQISASYEHEFSETRHSGGDSDYLTGLARADVQLTRTLSFEAGGLATRTRGNLGGGRAPFDDRDTSKIYAVYAGPSFASNAGPVQLSANYRIGYTKVTGDGFGGGGNGFGGGFDGGYGGGVGGYGDFDHATTQTADATAAVQSGVVAPFGITLSGAWERDQEGQLDQRFDDKFARLDLVQPVSPTFAVTGGVGYEDVTVTQKDPLVDASGNVVLDSHGNVRADKSSPRRVAYDFDGLYWDAGVIWRPSPRTSLEAHFGERYHTFSGFGVLSYQPSPDVALQVDVYDSQETFAHQLQERLHGLPSSFVSARDRFGQQFNGCVFGNNGKAGGCLDAVFQSLSGASYRARGVDAVASFNRGPNTFGVGAGYANRSFHAPHDVPGVTLYGIEDQSYYAEAFYGRQIDRVSSFDANLFADIYDPGLAGGLDTYSAGASGSYTRSFGRLGATATLGVYTFDQKGDDNSDVTGELLLGARYQF